MSTINYITFNQDHSLLAVGTTDGFRIYSLDPFTLLFQTPLTENGASGDISILEMLFSTSLVAMILTPRLLRIINTKRQSTICELTFPTAVGALRLNRKRLMVVLEDIIFLYDMQTMKVLHHIQTPSNPHAICAMSPHPENNYIAYPLRKKEYIQPQSSPTHIPSNLQKTTSPMGGDVMLFDANNLQEVTVIPAHQTALSCIAMNNQGTLLATASEKGTIIRVFALPSARKLFQFRRGSTPSRIHYMSFNATSTLLCVASATETIHIFKLSPQTTSTELSSPPLESPRARSQSPSSPTLPAPDSLSNTRPTNPGFMSMMRRTSQNVGTSLVSRAATYLPASVTEIWEPARDFAWVKVPRSHVTGQIVKSVVVMAPGAPQVLVATNEGDLLVFNIDLEIGGEGVLVRQYSVRDKSESHTGLYAE